MQENSSGHDPAQASDRHPSAFYNVISAVTGNVWPAIPNPRSAQLLSLLWQLEQSQWLPREQLVERTAQQLFPLYRHAYQHVLFYTERFDAAGCRPESMRTPADWLRVPVLTRSDVQLARSQLNCPTPIPAHGRTQAVLTTGSTGAPISVLQSNLTGVFWSAFVLRDHVWHKRDFRQKTVSIRMLEGTSMGPDDVATTWGVATHALFRTGPSAALEIRTPIPQQAEWLVAQNPDYLITYPSNAFALARHFREHGLTLPRLREVRTFGEQLEPYVRQECRDVWGVKVSDVYSSQELGHLAIQCPDHEHYHVQSENVLLEVLRDDGTPCDVGEVGRVVVTALHNFATPLIRYELGDYAEVGPPCACGRGLPVLSRIMGRQRNMAVLPDGRRVWPSITLDVVGGADVELPPVRQFQVVQRTREALDVSLVAARPLAPEEEMLVSAWIQFAFCHPFVVRFSYVDAIPRGPGGKYEDFRCELPPDDL